MSITKPRTFQELLSGQETPLKGLLARSKQLQELGILLHRTLGPELGAHCQLANIRNSILVLAVPSTAWATRLRYQIPQLLQKLKSDNQLREISNIEILITPTASPDKPPRSGHRVQLSSTAASCLEDCAEIISDTHLRSALKHLAGRKAPRR